MWRCFALSTLHCQDAVFCFTVLWGALAVIDLCVAKLLDLSSDLQTASVSTFHSFSLLLEKITPLALGFEQSHGYKYQEKHNES